jgi:PAS domain-containing protein
MRYISPVANADRLHLGDQNIIGRSHYDVFPEIPDRWKKIHQRTLAGSVQKCEEDVFLGADGKIDWMRWEIHPWSKTGGEIGGIIMFTEIINEQKLQRKNCDRARQQFGYFMK